jgi:acetyltransferase-like isoleucine patch superfamily enzyme
MGRMHRQLIHVGDQSYHAGIEMIEPNYQHIYIGKYTSIAVGAKAIMAGHHTDWITTYPFCKWPEMNMKKQGHPAAYGDIKIGNDVWIGANVTLMGGITINDGAIIAASALVKYDVEAYEIVGGVPAKHIRYRYTQDRIDQLLEIAWWDWERSKVVENLTLLTSDRIDDFLAKHGRV